MSIFLDTLQGKKTTRPPVWFMRQAGRVLPSYLKLREQYSFHELMRDPKLAADVTLLPVHDIGIDAAILFSDILVIPESLGMELKFTDKGPRFSEPLNEVRGIEESLEEKLAFNPDFLNYIYDAIGIIRSRKTPTADGEEVPLIGFCGGPLTVLCYMWEGLGTNHEFPKTMAMIYQKPDLVRRFVDLITEASIAYAQKQVQSGVQAFQLFETWAALVPWTVYRQLFLPAALKILAAVREKNVPTIFFPRGAAAGLRDLGGGKVHALGIDWQTPLDSARLLTGDEPILQGNIDPRLVAGQWSAFPEERLQPILDFGRHDHHYILNLGHGVLPGTPVDNVKQLVQWIKTSDWYRS